MRRWELFLMSKYQQFEKTKVDDDTTENINI